MPTRTRESPKKRAHIRENLTLAPNGNVLLCPGLLNAQTHTEVHIPFPGKFEATVVILTSAGVDSNNSNSNRHCSLSSAHWVYIVVNQRVPHTQLLAANDGLNMVGRESTLFILSLRRGARDRFKPAGAWHAIRSSRLPGS